MKPEITGIQKATVSIVNETAIGMYEPPVGHRKGFLLESYDKNYEQHSIRFLEKNRKRSLLLLGVQFAIRR